MHVFPALADWRFVLLDVRDGAGQPLALDGFEIKATFEAGLAREPIQTCSRAGGQITVTPVSGKGPTIAIEARAAARPGFDPRADVLVTGDVMLFGGAGAGRTADRIERILFRVEAGTTRPDA